MNLEYLGPGGCNGGDCPSVYRADNGNYVVQGWNIDDDTRRNLRNLGDSETAVEVPAAVIEIMIRIEGTL